MTLQISKRALSGALLCLLCTGQGVSAQEGVTPPPDWPAQAQVKRSTTGAEVENQIPTGFGIPCTISPKQTVELAAPFGGIIESVAVRPGQIVAQGDVIATFDSAALRSELAIAQKRANATKGLEIATSRLAGLEKRLSRLKSASESRSVPAADLENAQLEVDIARGEVGREAETLALAQLELGRAQVMVDKSIILAPVAGRIGETLIDPGESPTQAPIATIYVTTPMKIEAYVPTAQVAGFLKSTEFSARIAGTVYPVEFDHRGSVADLSSNTLSVFFNITAEDVLPGLDCKILDAAAAKQ